MLSELAALNNSADMSKLVLSKLLVQNESSCSNFHLSFEGEKKTFFSF